MSLTLDPEHVIELWTRNGTYRIELWSGDITQLQKEDPVDILMVSAFPNDYEPLPGTVLGALHKNLGLNVYNLSYNKEMDLRQHFSCWLSRPVRQRNCPFKKVLCFERRNYHSDIPEQISDMFRVFTPVFNNTDHTVATPLLATGDQGHDKKVVLETMIEAAAEWIFAGLPLRVLKIVMYEGISKDINEMFQRLKAKHVEKSLKLKKTIFEKLYDVYIAFNKADMSYVDKLREKLCQVESTVKVYIQDKHFKADSVWQEEIFNIMVASKRIITVLSPAFMASTECLEEYNMAMCCNRLMGINVLAPVLVETIENLPSYMGLVQWLDCRIRKEGDSTESKLVTASKAVIAGIKLGHSMLSKDVKPDDKEKFEYDVFISYSHKNPDQAETILKIFAEIDPKLKVFYDRSELTTGTNWQNMLYQCVGECRCMIALISPTYISSIVCMEEFNLAYARHLCKDKGLKLMPMLIEDVAKDKMPDHITSLQPTKAIEDFQTTARKLAHYAVMVLKPMELAPMGLFMEEQEDIYEKFSTYRCEMVRRQMEIDITDTDSPCHRIIPLEIPHRDFSSIDEEHTDIALIYANDSTYLAGTLCALIDRMYPNLNISVHTVVEQKRFNAIDTATRIVIFLSEQFLSSEHHVHELHLSLSRQRSSDKNILYLIQTHELTGRPFFPRILKYDLVCTDPVWMELQILYLKGKREAVKKTITTKKRSRLGLATMFNCHHREFFAMQKAADDILEALLYNKDEKRELSPLLVNLSSYAILPPQPTTAAESQDDNERRTAEVIPEHGEDDDADRHSPETQHTTGRDALKHTDKPTKHDDSTPKHTDNGTPKNSNSDTDKPTPSDGNNTTTTNKEQSKKSAPQEGTKTTHRDADTKNNKQNDSPKSSNACVLI